MTKTQNTFRISVDLARDEALALLRFLQRIGPRD
jgi:hypothetical protein